MMNGRRTQVHAGAAGYNVRYLPAAQEGRGAWGLPDQSAYQVGYDALSADSSQRSVTMMNLVSTKSLTILLVAGLSCPSQAASLFATNSSPFFSIAPYTQMGSAVDQLAINQLTTGYMVAGQFQVSVPAGAVSGTLLHYQVKRLLNPTFGSQSMYLQQFIVGFSQPSGGGTFSTTTGYCKTYLDYSGQPANTPLSLVNGAATWNVNASGNTFNYVSGTDVYLVQDFELDGSKLGGPAGTWIVDLPVQSLMAPEPGSLATLGLGLLLVCRRQRTPRARAANSPQKPITRSSPAAGLQGA